MRRVAVVFASSAWAAALAALLIVVSIINPRPLPATSVVSDEVRVSTESAVLASTPTPFPLSTRALSSFCVEEGSGYDFLPRCRADEPSTNDGCICPEKTDERGQPWTRLEEPGVRVPPTADKTYTILTRAVGVTEYAINTSSVGTTPTAAFATDLSTTQQTDAFVQQFTVFNTHASQSLCVKPIAWASAGANCAAKCAAQTITCSGAATDGKAISAGAEWPGNFDGTACVCVVGSGASTTFQSTRVVR